MIATEHIHANASTPNFPLRPFVAHVGSPSQLRIVGLPLAIGSWHITAVQVTANYPDNTSQSVNCVKTGNAWSATIPASAAPGMSKNGYLVTADGVDENNNPVSGYVLGMGDVIILNRDSTITVGETTYYLHLVDETPDNPHKGDVDITTGKVYDGTQWIALATLDWDDVKPSGGVPKTDLASSVQTSLGKADTALQPSDLDDAVTRTSANGVKSSGIWSMLWGALTALPAGFSSLYDWCVAQLVGKLSTSGGTVTGDISMPNGLLDAGDVQTRSYFDFRKSGENPRYLDSPENSGKALTDADLQDSSSALGAAFAGKLDKSGDTMTGALRFGYDTAGFAAIIFTEVSDGTSIGSYGVKRADQSVGASWPFRDGTLALIQDIADNFSSSVSYDKDSLCSYNSTIYRCINPNGHTGAWVDADFTPATVEDVLAALRTGKANRASSATAGNLAALDANGNPTDAGYHFEVRNGIPCIVQYT